MIETRTFTIGDGGILVLYTDGLVENRGQDIDDGLARLRGVFGPEALLSPLEDLAKATLDGAYSDHDRDDIAVLIARLRRLPDEHVVTMTLPARPSAVREARGSVREHAGVVGAAGAVLHRRAAGVGAGHERAAVRHGRHRPANAARPHAGLRGPRRLGRPAASTPGRRRRRERPRPPGRPPPGQALGRPPRRPRQGRLVRDGPARRRRPSPGGRGRARPTTSDPSRPTPSSDGVRRRTWSAPWRRGPGPGCSGRRSRASGW